MDPGDQRRLTSLPRDLDTRGLPEMTSKCSLDVVTACADGVVNGLRPTLPLASDTVRIYRLDVL